MSKKKILSALLILAALPLFSQPPELSLSSIHRFTKVFPKISQDVANALSLTRLDSQMEIETAYKNFTGDKPLAQALTRGGETPAFAKELFTVLVGAVVASFEDEMQFLSQELGRAAQKEDIAQAMRDEGVDEAGIALSMQSYDTVQRLKNWLGKKNLSAVQKNREALIPALRQWQ